MQRTNPTNGQSQISPQDMGRLQMLTALTNRLEMAGKFGFSHGGDRDLYKTLGYPQDVDYKEMVALWKRQGIARATVDRPVKATWKGDMIVTEPDEEQETEIEQAYKQLDESIDLKSKLIRVDRLSQLGEYAVLLLGFDDVEDQNSWAIEVEGEDRELRYARPIGRDNADIATYERDTSNPRFGKPRTYEINIEDPIGTINEETSKSTSLTVHHSRIIHIAFDLLENEIEGDPITKAIYNRFKDLEKLVGGSAEMFWRGSRPGYFGSAKEDYKMGTNTEDDLKKQIDEYEHNLRRILVSEGMEMESLDQQVADPSGAVSVQLQMISAATGIPLRILTGSERGELASSQDRQAWDSFIGARRTEEVEPLILRPFVDRMIQYGVFPEPRSNRGYSIVWPNPSGADEQEKAEVAQARAQALQAYARSPVTEQMVPLEAFLKFFLQLDEDTTNQILEMSEAEMDEMLAEEAELEQEQQEFDNSEEDE